MGAETISLIGVAGCWLAAIVHAYLVGKKIDLIDCGMLRSEEGRQRPEVRKQKTDDRFK